MAPLGKLRATFVTIILAASFGITGLVGCGRNPEADLLSAVHDIDRSMARRLVADDDSTLAWYARSVGICPFRDAGSTIVARLHANSPEDFLEVKATLLAALTRIATIYRIEFGCGFFDKEVEFWSAVSAEDAVLLGRLRIAGMSLTMDTTRTTAAKIDTLRGFVAQYQSIGYLPGVVNGLHTLGHLMSGVDKSEQLAYFRRALAGAQAAEMDPMVCQILGTLGHEAAVAGHTDSMSYYWNRSRDLAERHKLPYFSARIYEFYARHYQTQGKLALSHELLNEAQEVCRRLKGGYRELRFVVKLIEFYNDLERWDVSGRLLQRADLLERQIPANLVEGYRTTIIRARLARARYDMGMERADDAEKILNEIKSAVRQQPNRDEYPRMLYMWGEHALQFGRFEETAALVDEGLARSREVNYPYIIPMFHALRAELEFERGRHEAALSALREFETSTQHWPAKYEREWITSDAIRVRVLLARGLADSAVVELGNALSRLERYLEERDASTHGYLWLAQTNQLRDLLHEVTAGDPVAAYGAEMYWRSLPQRLGAAGLGLGDARDASDGRNLIDNLRALATRAQKRIIESNQVHCVYRVGEYRLHRITVTADGIRQDKLSVPAEELWRLAPTVWEQLSDDAVDADATIPTSLVTMLRALALQLLPPEVLEVRVVSPKQLLISPDGFLATLPFETFNLAADGTYSPLLADWNVAYLRRAESMLSGTRRRPPSAELLVADPALDESTRHRLSLGQPLPAASKEAADIATYLENPIVLDGVDATKQRLTGSWEDASMLYVAAHFLSNPVVPYLTMLPLHNPTPDAAPDAGLVDVSDVRGARLAGCELVVLSGCATGAPVAAGRVSGPGFGDVFLDAGAGAVVQTFWTVRDDQAHPLMKAFVRQWRQAGQSPVRALCGVRREVMTGPNGIRHPYRWASFSIELGHL